MWSAWRALKDHAKARTSEFWPNGIPFTLTLRQFITFARASNYLNRTGLNGHCLTVDRKDPTRGYVRGNIQPMTRIANSIKQARRDAIKMAAGLKWKQK